MQRRFVDDTPPAPSGRRRVERIAALIVEGLRVGLIDGLIDGFSDGRSCDRAIRLLCLYHSVASCRRDDKGANYEHESKGGGDE